MGGRLPANTKRTSVLTGATTLAGELWPKRLEILREVVPKATVIALLINPTNAATEAQAKDLQAVARTLGLQVRVLQASTDRDLDPVFANLSQLRVGGLVIGSDGFVNSRSQQLAALTCVTRFRLSFSIASSLRPVA
jgi:putative ABC transport system substrate-binding protein